MNVEHNSHEDDWRRPPFDHPEDGPTVPPLFPGEELVVMFKQEPMDTTPFHMMPAELAAEALPEARDQYDMPTFPANVLTKRLVEGYYLSQCQELESQLSNLKVYLLQHQTPNAEALLMHIRSLCHELVVQWEDLKSATLLLAPQFFNLQKLEEHMASVLLPQLQLYEIDLQKLITQTEGNDFSVCLVICSQGVAGPVFKEKPIGPFTLRLLTGAANVQIQAGPVQPELVEFNHQQRPKRNNDLENCKQSFKENGTAVFSELKFNNGTFPNFARLRFKVEVSPALNGQGLSAPKMIESGLSHPYISLTNTGSQWKDAAGAWLKEDCFQDAFEITTIRFCNYLQKHYLIATKQEIENVKRPLHPIDFDFLLRAKFTVGLERTHFSQKDFTKFWDWFGPSLKKLRYQKHLLWMFEQGYIPAFITSADAEQVLLAQPFGTFMIRISSRIDGEFVLSYSHSSGVRHYLISNSEATTLDKKKLIIELLAVTSFLTHVMQLTYNHGQRQWHAHPKEKVLSKWYKKPKPVTRPESPYDERLFH